MWNDETMMSMLDLPELALDSILERLSPAELCSMAAVCTSRRERCTSADLWEKHMKQKWGKIIGPAASREWQLWHHHQAANSSKKWWLLMRDVASSLFRYLHSWFISSYPDDFHHKWPNPGHHRGYPRATKTPCVRCFKLIQVLCPVFYVS